MKRSKEQRSSKRKEHLASVIVLVQIMYPLNSVWHKCTEICLEFGSQQQRCHSLLFSLFCPSVLPSVLPYFLPQILSFPCSCLVLMSSQRHTVSSSNPEPLSACPIIGKQRRRITELSRSGGISGGPPVQLLCSNRSKNKPKVFPIMHLFYKEV